MSKFKIGDKVKHVDDDNYPARTVAGVDKHLDLVCLAGKAGWFPAEQFELLVQGEVGEMKMPEYGTPHYPVITDSTACPGTGPKTTSSAAPGTEPKTTITYSNASATTVTLPDDTSHFPIGTTLTYDGKTLEIKPSADESARRKAMPVCTGVLDYFGAALLEVSKLSKFGGDKHAPGEPLHHARGRSADHPDALLRHLIERGTVDPDSGLSHTVGVAWRALAMLQEELEAAGAPLARGAKK